jgi:hypothetical protein
MLRRLRDWWNAWKIEGTTQDPNYAGWFFFWIEKHPKIAGLYIRGRENPGDPIKTFRAPLVWEEVEDAQEAIR